MVLQVVYYASKVILLIIKQGHANPADHLFKIAKFANLKIFAIRVMINISPRMEIVSCVVLVALCVILKINAQNARMQNVQPVILRAVEFACKDME